MNPARKRINFKMGTYHKGAPALFSERSVSIQHSSAIRFEKEKPKLRRRETGQQAAKPPSG
jgi:hypothetical protein